MENKETLEKQPQLKETQYKKETESVEVPLDPVKDHESYDSEEEQYKYETQEVKNRFGIAIKRKKILHRSPYPTRNSKLKK
jgi:hypothetical protein